MAGLEHARTFDAVSINGVPMMFREKQILAITLHDAFLTFGGKNPLLHSFCEVYAPRGPMTNVCNVMKKLIQSSSHFHQIAEFFAEKSDRDIDVDDDVISLLPPFFPHYGHWLAEGVPMYFKSTKLSAISSQVSTACSWHTGTGLKGDSYPLPVFCFQTMWVNI